MTDTPKVPMSEARLAELEEMFHPDQGEGEYWQAPVVRELVAEVRLQRAGRKRALDAATAALDQRDSFASKLAVALEALRWYADDENWDAQGRCLRWLPHSKVHLADKGDRARAALEKLKKLEGGNE